MDQSRLTVNSGHWLSDVHHSPTSLTITGRNQNFSPQDGINELPVCATEHQSWNSRAQHQISSTNTVGEASGQNSVSARTVSSSHLDRCGQRQSRRTVRRVALTAAPEPIIAAVNRFRSTIGTHRFRPVGAFTPAPSSVRGIRVLVTRIVPTPIPRRILLTVATTSTVKRLPCRSSVVARARNSLTLRIAAVIDNRRAGIPNRRDRFCPLDRRNIVEPPAGRVSLPRRDMAEQMVLHPFHFIRRRTRRNDFQIAINLH